MAAVFHFPWYVFVLLKVITSCENPRGAECILTILIHMEYTLVKCGLLCMTTKAAVFASSHVAQEQDEDVLQEEIAKVNPSPLFSYLPLPSSFPLSLSPPSSLPLSLPLPSFSLLLFLLFPSPSFPLSP